ncbi:MAG: ATP-grasp domain-containing protein [Candidatus Absconditabacterales bacterium]|nr:ATP-grasp domain-containing protein [Candidatus Absconditabacterales bacterium]
MYLIGFYSKKKLHKLHKFDYYKKEFKELIKIGVKVIYFYKEDNSFVLEKKNIENIKKIGVTIVEFKSETEIITYLKNLNGKIFINTFEEQEIKLVNQIRLDLQQQTTNNPNIFLNKYLQRSIIGQKYPETIVDYRLLSMSQLVFIKEDDIKKYPYIMKPTGGIQSSGVSKIENYDDYIKSINFISNSIKQLKEKKLTEQEILLEEYIDGDMYTIDYYVDEEQKINLSKPVLVKLGVDYGIKDFCNVVRIISKNIEKKVDQKKLKEFIDKTVKGGQIKNTFIHHEFKINSKGEFKTIEINGRIGGYRLELYQLGYNIKLLSFPFITSHNKKLFKNNVASFVLYPKEKSIFLGYNQEIIKKIKKLKSFYRLNKVNELKGQKIGLTRDGYSKVGAIILKNRNEQEFENDLKFMEEIYFKILKTKKNLLNTI